MPAHERREDHRVAVHCPVYYEVQGQRFRGHLRDLSAKGAFILTSATHAKAECIRVYRSVKDAEKSRLEGHIQRVETGAVFEGATWPGFALRFEPADPQARSFVDALLAETV